MKSIFSFAFLLFVMVNICLAQEPKTASAGLKFFNRTELSYTFGLNETFNTDKTNALHLKTILGFAYPKAGFGLGIENANFKSANSGGGANFNTIAFSGNIHLLSKDINDKGLNLFIKGGAGYAPRIFRGYDKGFTFEIATGFMITTKKGSRYFLQGIYHDQKIENFFITTGSLEIKSAGIGVGTWF